MTPVPITVAADLWDRLSQSDLGVVHDGPLTLTLDRWDCGCCGLVCAYFGYPYAGPLDDCHSVYGLELGGTVVESHEDHDHFLQRLATFIETARYFAEGGQ